MTGTGDHVAAVALNTFRETVRDRIFYLVGVFGLVLIGSSAILSPLTVGAQGKVVADVGLASLSLFGLLVVVFVGSGMLHKEIDKRTITTILAKPVSRRAYVAGKFGGLILTLACMLAAMGALFLLVTLWTPVPLNPGYAAAFGFAFLELAVVTAVAVLLSTFVSPVLAAVLTLALFVVGHVSSDLKAFGALVGGPALRLVTSVLFYVLPNLEVFNVRGAVVHGDPVSGAHLALAALYATCYVALCLVLAGAIFTRRELK